MLLRSLVLIGLVAASLSAAAQTAVDAFDRGSYLRNFSGTTPGPITHNPDNTNHLTGRSFFATNVGADFRSYFAFDLSSFAGQTITSATLHLFNPVNGFFQFNPAANSGPFETLQIFDVSTSASALLGSFGDQAIFDDLGAGVSYGSINIGAADNGSFVDIALNAAGLEAVNAAAGSAIFFGGRVTSIDAGAGTQQVFSWSNSQLMSDTQLVVTSVTPIPEPETYAMLVAGLALLGFHARRRRAKAGIR